MNERSNKKFWVYLISIWMLSVFLLNGCGAKKAVSISETKSEDPIVQSDRSEDADTESPIIVPKETSANYGESLRIEDLVSISDNRDDTLSMKIVSCDSANATISPDCQAISFSRPGTYTLQMAAWDLSENAAEAEVTVQIFDKKSPIILSVMDKYPILERISAAEIASAEDEIDGPLEVLIAECDGNAEIAKDGRSIVFKETGQYTVGVTATDFSANENRELLTISVINDHVPKLTLSKTTIEISDSDTAHDFSKYITAESPVYGDLSKEVVIDDSAVKYGKPGKYKVRYHLTDKDGNSVQKKLKVVIKDKTAPTIKNSVKEFTLTEGDEKPDYLAGMTASDSKDGDLTKKIKVDDSSVNYAVPGIYTVIYTVKDKAGNTSKIKLKVTVKQKAIVLPTPAPVVVEEPKKEVPSGTTYVLNTNTGKFHRPGCGSVATIKPYNRQDFVGSREEVISRGFVPCKRCNP